jgi:hypothetical protein
MSASMSAHQQKNASKFTKVIVPQNLAVFETDQRRGPIPGAVDQDLLVDKIRRLTPPKSR